jgi:hypothetical protein
MGETSIPPEQLRNEAAQLTALREAGFEADFDVRAEGLVLRGVGPVDPSQVHIDARYRFEGASNPDDEAVVMGLHDTASGTRGVLISGYGPAASEREADVLAVLGANPSCRS